MVSLPALVADVVRQHGDRVALRVRDGDDWNAWTYTEFWQQARRLAAALIERGIQAGDRVVIFSHNRPEWTIADVAIMAAGAVPVPIYQTSTPDQVAHIVRDSGARSAFVEGADELGRIHWDEMPSLESVITFDPVESSDERVSMITTVVDHDLDLGVVDDRMAGLADDDLAAIIYTSGTTGDPKGAMLTHGGITSQIPALNELFKVSPDDHSLCFLPLSHAFERAWTFFVLSHGCMNTYCTDPRTVADMLVLVKPTLFVSVPKLYEKVYAVAHEKVAASAAKKKIFTWATRVGGQLQRQHRKGKIPSWVWRSQLPFADALVLKNIREAIGGPKTVMAAGGAPLRREVEEFFSAAGVLICQGYGLTEASPLVSFNADGEFKFGTAGRVMSGSEVKIGEDGEILYRGPNLMKGYWNQPEASADTIKDGWLYTGDIGYVDNDGFLVITDRKKDLIITSNGKNIAPAPIEGQLLADPLFEYAVLLGDNRPCLTLLVKPSLPHLEDLAKQLHVAWDSREELFDHPQIVEEMRRRVGDATSRLANHEQVRDLRVLIEDFTQENGLLTPTLKVKRREVEKRFVEVIEDMYARINERRRGSGGDAE